MPADILTDSLAKCFEMDQITTTLPFSPFFKVIRLRWVLGGRVLEIGFLKY